MKEIVYKDKKKYIKKLIDVYSAVFVPEDLWLSDKNKDYFALLVIANSLGIDLDSKECTQFLRDNGFDISNPYMYKNRIKKKGWLQKTEHGTILPKAFDYSQKFLKSANFKFKIKFIDAEEEGE